MLHLGEKAPDVEAQTTQGRLNLFDWAADSWIVLFSYPKAGTRICTMEMQEAGRMHEQFAASNARLVGISLDSAQEQEEWAATCNADKVLQISDPDAKTANIYGMIQPALPDLTVRVLYIIGPDRKVHLVQAYPSGVARSFAEVHKALDAIRARLSKD